MKKIVVITFMMLISIMISDCAPEQPHPIDCYEVTLIVSSATGDIIKNSAKHAFIYEVNDITYWEGISSSTVRDSINHTITIKMTKCITIDSKDKYPI